jgi:hypothetical protein
VADLDRLVEDLVTHFEGQGVRSLILSEYGIEPTLDRGGAIFINRILREAGLLGVRVEDGRELLDPGACRAFAVADHQAAHVYHCPDVELPPIPGARRVELNHERAGDTVLVAGPGRWFTYDYWPADRPALAPDFARTVEIHRKPGYDPRELFCGVGRLGVARRLLRKKLGFRQLMDVVPLDTDLVRGTHGRADLPGPLLPVLIGRGGEQLPMPSRGMHDVIQRAIFD